ncbi:MAG TPA: hypothetical protein VKB76_13500 [Ktedonobacterales bacterium]|nr:hypothetical protein [Ktedonobacterales bacterium]
MHRNDFQQQQQRQQQEMLQRQQQQFQQFSQHAQQEHQRMAQDFQRMQRNMPRGTNTLDPTTARTLRRGAVIIFAVFAALFLIVLVGVIVIFTQVLSHFPH